MQLELKKLSKNYGNRQVVDSISYTLDYGVYGLLGVNGVGKTTLIRMICTLLTPTSGQILYDGMDIGRLGDQYRKNLGYLPQDFGFYPELSVYDYMMYIATLKGLLPVIAKKRAEMLLDKVSLLKDKHRKMGTLSGGMQRRVGIAQAMLNNPKILILDEPTAGLDPNERIRFRNLISELAEDRLVLLSTHIVSDVAYIAKEILLMKEGKLLQTGNCDSILAGMDKKVWLVKTDKDGAEVAFAGHLIANKKHVADGVELRIISAERPVEGAVLQEATLEDAFLCYFGESGVVEHDKI